jgi:hypothetical protein
VNCRRDEVRIRIARLDLELVVHDVANIGIAQPEALTPCKRAFNARARCPAPGW